MQRRQPAANNGLGEQGYLLFTLDARFGLLGNGHVGRRRFDEDRLMQLNAPLFFLNDHFTLLGDFLADLPVAPGVDATVEKAEPTLEHNAQLLKGPQPRHPGENAPAGSHHRQQQQGRASVAKLGSQHATGFNPEQSTRRQRQGCLD